MEKDLRCFLFVKLSAVQWDEFLQLGVDTSSDDILEQRVRKLAPNACCSLIYTVCTANACGDNYAILSRTVTAAMLEVYSLQQCNAS